MFHKLISPKGHFYEISLSAYEKTKITFQKFTQRCAVFLRPSIINNSIYYNVFYHQKPAPLFSVILKVKVKIDILCEDEGFKSISLE